MTAEPVPTHRPTATTAAAAVALRLAGASFSEIATTLGYDSPRMARRAVEIELARGASDEPAREAERRESAARLERLIRALSAKALDHNHPDQIAAARTVLAIEDRRIRLLGLDAPSEVILHTPSMAELDVWVGEVIASTQPEVNLEEDDIFGPEG